MFAISHLRRAAHVRVVPVAAFAVLSTGTNAPVGAASGSTFIELNVGLLGLNEGSAAWGDYDADGDLDVLLTGLGTAPTTVLYRNDGGAFANVNAGIASVSLSDAAFGDYDRDGDLDVLVSGATTGPNVSRVYRNDGGTFTDIGAGLVGLVESAVAWGDYDAEQLPCDWPALADRDRNTMTSS